MANIKLAIGKFLRCSADAFIRILSVNLRHCLKPESLPPANCMSAPAHMPHVLAEYAASRYNKSIFYIIEL